MKNITKNNKQNNLISKIKQFFSTNGWEPLPYQIETWEAFLNGDSGIIQVPTGCGKTYAALMGPLSKIEDPKNNKSVNILLITPLKALSRDLKNSIQLAALHFNKEITVEIRNGDTTPYEKKKQLAKPPNILITTPESLSLLLSNKESNNLFKELSSIIIDEWHELMGSKRGNQCELSLSWLRGSVKNLQIWAMSATIGNIEEAARAIVGMSAIKPKIISTSIEDGIDFKQKTVDKLNNKEFTSGFIYTLFDKNPTRDIDEELLKQRIDDIRTNDPYIYR